MTSVLRRWFETEGGSTMASTHIHWNGVVEVVHRRCWHESQGGHDVYLAEQRCGGETGAC
jgi:hypothetical protein